MKITLLTLLSLVLVSLPVFPGGFTADLSTQDSPVIAFPASPDLNPEEKLGCIITADSVSFALFAPRAAQITIEIFDTSLNSRQNSPMRQTSDGIWRFTSIQDLTGMFYGYHITGNDRQDRFYQPAFLIADPYSSAVMTQNDYRHQAYTLIIDESFDWGSDTWLEIDWQDLVIYEAHIRDLTAHKSSGLLENLRGTYLGTVHPAGRSGINHLQTLGVNAIELLPAQEFANIEIPFQVEINGVTNTWNPYSRNHWGYMTSYFFAPESYYASDGSLDPGEFLGGSGRAVREFKQMVTAFHQAGIAVIMDVVYNHTSQYDYQPLKYIDRKYYYNLDSDNNFTSLSGCGNDLNTARPMTRKLIIDSLKKWALDYHIDGFRFDLAAMLDWQTLSAIRDELTFLNPHIILIAEPWGGGKYDPAGMSEHGLAAWNDVFRNTIKGQNPIDGQGFIFGKLWENADIPEIQSLIQGYEIQDGGFFQSSAHSVNYLESHDDHTLGDFIRLALLQVTETDSIADPCSHNKLTPGQMQLHKLAAFILFTSQGPIMLAEGQEYARSKVIAPSSAPDANIGRIDHNSYNKDNETNWLNYDFMDDNMELVKFYRNLISLRAEYPILKHSSSSDYTFFPGSNPLSFGYTISSDLSTIAVLYNGNPSDEAEFILNAPSWRAQFWTESIKEIKWGAKTTSITQKPSSGCFLVKN